MEELFTIGEVARLLDVPTATLRFWEEKGLFSVEKGEVYIVPKTRELGISEGTSRSQLSRARIWLQERLLERRNRK